MATHPRPVHHKRRGFDRFPVTADDAAGLGRVVVAQLAHAHRLAGSQLVAGRIMAAGHVHELQTSFPERL